MKYIYLTLLFTFSVQAQGLKFSPQETIDEIPGINSEKYGFAADLPYSASLERYVPPVLSQEGGTCVGFSTFYYALSTMYNQQFNITDARAKYVHAFDPYFIYSIVYNENDDCESGLYFNDALDLLYKAGSKKLFYPPFTSCDTKWTKDELLETIPYTSPYSVSQYYSFKSIDREFIETTKELISSYNTPVIVGMSYVKSMAPYGSSNTRGVSSSGLWNPSVSETEEGGHALCIVGYDDYKFGGAVRIVNSWGRDYGDDGYMWVKYTDLLKYVKEAYIVELNENIKNQPPRVIDQADYKRLSFQNKNYNTYNYEGQYLDFSRTGYGILTSKSDGAYFVGEYRNGAPRGYFLIMDEDGLYSAVVRNGEFTEIEKLGFASDSEFIEIERDARKHFSKLGMEFIRKANSTKNLKND